ncbi:hypothetical protein GGX14DRAFT_600852 [Mycena pura]|uniref:Uncharacterized protein n=1 Tax=Mycena pura TaxID=153505 RepID=A0AAD6UNA7_9AGAR|nr:hypothetical protein GGX14DRAFT_600852 [Mycena pura]
MVKGINSGRLKATGGIYWPSRCFHSFVYIVRALAPGMVLKASLIRRRVGIEPSTQIGGVQEARSLRRRSRQPSPLLPPPAADAPASDPVTRRRRPCRRANRRARNPPPPLTWTAATALAAAPTAAPIARRRCSPRRERAAAYLRIDELRRRGADLHGEHACARVGSGCAKKGWHSNPASHRHQNEHNPTAPNTTHRHKHRVLLVRALQEAPVHAHRADGAEDAPGRSARVARAQVRPAMHDQRMQRWQLAEACRAGSQERAHAVVHVARVQHAVPEQRAHERGSRRVTVKYSQAPRGSLPGAVLAGERSRGRVRPAMHDQRVQRLQLAEARRAGSQERAHAVVHVARVQHVVPEQRAHERGSRRVTVRYSQAPRGSLPGAVLAGEQAGERSRGRVGGRTAVGRVGERAVEWAGRRSSGQAVERAGLLSYRQQVHRVRDCGPKMSYEASIWRLMRGRGRGQKAAGERPIRPQRSSGPSFVAASASRGLVLVAMPDPRPTAAGDGDLLPLEEERVMMPPLKKDVSPGAVSHRWGPYLGVELAALEVRWGMGMYEVEAENVGEVDAIADGASESWRPEERITVFSHVTR